MDLERMRGGNTPRLPKRGRESPMEEVHTDKRSRDQRSSSESDRESFVGQGRAGTPRGPRRVSPLYPLGEDSCT